MRSTIDRPTGCRRLILALISVAIAVAGMQVVEAGPAAAHDQLLSSTPAANDQLDTAPTEVILRYSQKVLAIGTIGAIVIVVDGAGTTWTSDDPVVDETTVTAPLKEGMGDGSYEIRWQVVSADGHPISGIIPFTIGDAPAPVAMQSAANEPTPEPAAAPASDQLGLLRLVLIGGGGAVAALLLWWAISAWNHRRRPTPKNPEDPDTFSSH